MDAIELYVVRNSEGKYLRAIGYNGYGESWVDLKNAKVYTKKGVAQGRITWFSNNFPKFPVPELIPLIATVGEPIDQSVRLNKSKKKKEELELKRKLEKAQQEYNKAVHDLDKARNLTHINERLEKAQKDIDFYSKEYTKVK